MMALQQFFQHILKNHMLKIHFYFIKNYGNFDFLKASVISIF